ncbi:HPr family phosphocarrier protein [Psychromonas sp. MME2]|uniref:HPr family phosphocarrier protein n=1 Tax=Psychromonas sp. MME2 TaxID=3231033 RepID=UPI00339BC7BA
MQKRSSNLLNSKLQTEILFTSDLIQCAFPATDILQLTAVVAGLIKNQDAVENDFIAALINKEATYLGQGLWLTSSNQGIKKSALALVTVATPFTYQDKPVKGLLSIASNNKLHLNNLEILITLLQTEKIESLFSASATEIISLLTQQQPTGMQQVFTIKNPHGLHARPGAMLVHTAKQFTSQIQMINLNGSGKSVNAKSLMKVMTLGVQVGHQLQFSAEGEDAAQALEAIGKAIAQGLGETTV